MHLSTRQALDAAGESDGASTQALSAWHIGHRPGGVGRRIP
jgi:hypothetical protein